MLSKCFILFYILSCLNAQEQALYFPNEEGGVSRGDGIGGSVNINQSEMGATTSYQDFVQRIITKGITDFTLAINKVLLKTKTNHNVIFSPISISSALALVLMGSNGKTFQEVATALDLALLKDMLSKSQVIHEQFAQMLQNIQDVSSLPSGNQVTFASAIFVQNDFPIRNVYRKTAIQLYKSEILNVNFKSNPSAAQKDINEWVSGRTNGKINDILSDVPSQLTKIIIASVMYFKADWQNAFFDGLTKRRPFFMNGRRSPTKIEVDMMANGGTFPYYKDSTLNCEILGFPYKGSSTMYVVMPFDSNKEKLEAFEEKLTFDDLENLVNRTVPTATLILFPKMKLESTIDLKESLKALGIKSLFNPSESNLAILSPGEQESIVGVSDKHASVEINPLVLDNNQNTDPVLIFNRLGATVNCTQIFNLASNVTSCQHANTLDKGRMVYYKKFGNKIGRKINRRSILNIMDSPNHTIDSIRHLINDQSTANDFQNPHLYADKVIHKVYMDITEKGTEAAAATAVSLTRDGGRLTFRVDVPFFFFIRHKKTKTILFWGSVFSPTPSFKTE